MFDMFYILCTLCGVVDDMSKTKSVMCHIGAVQRVHFPPLSSFLYYHNVSQYIVLSPMYRDTYRIAKFLPIPSDSV